MKSRWIGLVFVVIFSVFFAVHQYHPGTWLMGWDSLHPEFNYELAFSRVFSGAWRESQGVGTVAVHSHMSELPRIATLWAIDWFVPTNAVRWTYILLMLILGIVGGYVLLVHILTRIRGRLGMGWVATVAIVGSLAYLFNLSTLHHYLVPFEMFVVLFGLLPWSLWSVSRYLQVLSASRLTIFLLIQFLISSSAFAATLWVVYFGVLVLTAWFLSSNKTQWLKVVALTLMVNSYWLLPTIYGLATTGGAVASAKINQIFSPEAWLNNVAYGTVQQVMRLESFILQWMSFDRVNNKFDLVVSQWINEVNLNYVWWTLNIVAGMVGMGLLRWFYLIVGKNGKESRRWGGLVFAGFLLFLLILSQVWPLSIAISWARENLPLVGEILRTPFTKVSIFLQLIYAVLISTGLLWIVEKVRFGLVRAMIIIATVIVIVFPFTSWVLRGNLMGDVVVTKTSEDYMQLFDATKKMGTGRMVAMPTLNMWGWEYRDWGNGQGYEGANFTQFGIAQTILIRDFDRWSPYNEGFYGEFSNALYNVPTNQQTNETTKNVQQVLDKYDVRYVLLDESVIAPGQDRGMLRIEETKRLASQLGWKQVFQEGFLTVWDRGEQDDTFVSAPVSYTRTEAKTNKVRRDVAWEGVGTYVSDNQKTLPAQAGQSVGESANSESRIVYPFAGLMSEEIEGVKYPPSPEASDGRGGVDGVRLTANGVQEGQELVIPGWQVGDIVRINFDVTSSATTLGTQWEPVPAYRVNDQNGPVFLGKEKPEEGKSYIVARVSEGEEWGEYLQDARFPASSLTSQGHSQIKIEVAGEPQVYDFSKQGQGTIGNCDVLKRGVADKIDAKYSADERGAVCDYVVMPELDTRLSYLVRMQGENKAGRSLKFFLFNTGSKRNDLEYLLDKNIYDQTFSLLPWSFDGTYTLNIETRSFGNYAENMVAPVEVRWLPLEQIASATLVGQNMVQDHRISNDLEVSRVKKYGTWLYVVETKNGGLLKLSQGYDEGWVSPYLEHVKVDGWANGWMVPAGEHSIAIFYWPQLLQYAGFVLLGVTIVVVVRHKN